MKVIIAEKPSVARNLFLAEGRPEDFDLNAVKIARAVVGIYGIYTLLGVIAFLFAGLSLFDSIVHAFTTISSGGFSTNSVGVGFYGSPALIASMRVL
jgi:trk system potassium uptake protein TrkH